MKDIFGIVAAAIAIYAYFPYLKEIVAGETKPKQATWLIWSLLGATYTFSAIFEGGAALLFTGADSIAQLSVLVFAIKSGV